MINRSKVEKAVKKVISANSDIPEEQVSGEGALEKYLGTDQLRLANVLMDIEKELGVDFPVNEEFEKIRTVDDLVNFFAKL